MLGHRVMTPSDYVSIARRRWALIAGLALVGGSLGYGIAYYLPKTYTSQTVVLVQEPVVPGDLVKPIVSDSNNQRLASMRQEILSRSRLEPIIQEFGLFRNDI